MSYGYYRSSAGTRPGAAETEQQFRQRNPEIAAWLDDSAASFEFAASLRAALQTYGSLTEKQLAAAQKCVAKRAEFRAAAVAREAAAVAVDASKIEQAFGKARQSGLKKLSLRLDGYTFKPAPAHGKNPGAIYVTEDGTYLGKINAGRFVRSRDCTDDAESAIQTICLDPHAAAVATGLKTGICSCCGRELTAEQSVDLGIGPICRERWGW